MNKTILITMGAVAVMGLSAISSAAGDVANGKTLFNKSECLKCHGTEVFTRPDRQVKDLASLEARVRMCDSQLSVNWFDDEIEDVVAYLNKQYYKFEEPAKSDGGK